MTMRAICAMCVLVATSCSDGDPNEPFSQAVPFSGAGSDLTCSDNYCGGSCGESCNIDCTAATCQADTGSSGSVECVDGATCDVVCRGDSCSVGCRGGSTCSLDCLGESCSMDCEGPGSLCRLKCTGDDAFRDVGEGGGC